MNKRESVCDLDLVRADYGWTEAKNRQPCHTFRVTFRRASGQETGRIDVDAKEAEQFAAEMEALAAIIRARLVKARAAASKEDIQTIGPN